MANSFSPLRWGIIGPGSIANRFANDVNPLPDHEIYAAGSRDKAKSEAFLAKYGGGKAYGSYEELVNDPEVDCVYVATPHPFHKEHALLALRAGKPVLCEKPFTINVGEAEEVVAEARSRGIFLMEGMWSRCFPAMKKARELAASGAIGKPRMLEADFGFKAGDTTENGTLNITNPNGRLFDLKLAGGALMDVGVYVVSLAQMFFGEPNKISAVATLGSSGVDENTGMVLGFPGGEIGILSTSLQTTTPFKATLLGSAGKIEIHSNWWTAKSITVHRNGQEAETITEPFDGGGFQFEAMHVADCLRAGKTESDIITLDETLAIMRTLDTIRAEIGLKYPME
jgi:predicted dehydrogenase